MRQGGGNSIEEDGDRQWQRVPLDFLASPEHPWRCFTNLSQVQGGKCCYRTFSLDARLHWGAWHRNGARRELSCGSCVAQVDISSLRYPPPFPHSQQPIAGTGRMGKEKRKKEMKHLPSSPGMMHALRGGCGCQNCKGQQILPIFICPW